MSSISRAKLPLATFNVVVLLIVIATGIGVAESGKHEYQLVFTLQQRQLADQIISVFENNTPTLQYSYISNLDDGRGYTAGRAGFTSATGDLLMVVERYSKLQPDTPLKLYLTRLKNLRSRWSGSVKGLDGLPAQWQKASQDPLFRQVQDHVVDELYFKSALRHAAEIGARTPLTLLLLYDTVLQHGDGDDQDGLPELIRCTNKVLGGNPGSGIDETQWAVEFLRTRMEVLKHAHNRATREAWAESVGRVDTLLKLVNDRQSELRGPIVINPWGTEFVLGS